MSESKFLELPSYYMVPDDKGHWMSRDRLAFYSERHYAIIYVEAGSINDLASIPWFLRRVFNVNGNHRPAAALHDELYASKGKISGLTLTRKECDQIFLDAMLSSRESYWTAYPQFVRDYLKLHGLDKAFKAAGSLVSKGVAQVMYLGVRIGGGSHF